MRWFLEFVLSPAHWLQVLCLPIAPWKIFLLKRGGCGIMIFPSFLVWFSWGNLCSLRFHVGQNLPGVTLLPPAGLKGDPDPSPSVTGPDLPTETLGPPQSGSPGSLQESGPRENWRLGPGERRPETLGPSRRLKPFLWAESYRMRRSPVGIGKWLLVLGLGEWGLPLWHRCDTGGQGPDAAVLVGRRPYRSLAGGPPWAQGCTGGTARCEGWELGRSYLGTSSANPNTKNVWDPLCQIMSDPAGCALEQGPGRNGFLNGSTLPSETFLTKPNLIFLHVPCVLFISQKPISEINNCLSTSQIKQMSYNCIILHYFLILLLLRIAEGAHLSMTLACWYKS